ncbi:DUF4129 domain-containing protein [Amycolatopsis silviterrae]|uniref:DUF4129 domain-containing protein n=1 Tax=Amycolatopsis silviterrae TaxID=1656914 RepID=A0ABW5HN95_9PSEU
MRHQGDTTLPGAVPAAGLLLALGAAGLRARAESNWSLRGPLAHASGTTLTVLITALGVVSALLALWSITGLRRRRKPQDDDFQHVYEPLGTKWGRRWAVLAVLGATVAPIVVLAVVASRARPAATPPPQFAPAPAEIPAQPAAGSHADGGSPWLLLAVVVLAVLALVALTRIRVRRSPRTGAPTGLAEAAEAGLSELGEFAEDGPRGAILRSFAAMERALTRTAEAAPRPADTPTAVLSRAANAGLVQPAPARRLVEVFAEARFSRHPITAAQQNAARRALDELLADLGRRP